MGNSVSYGFKFFSDSLGLFTQMNQKMKQFKKRMKENSDGSKKFNSYMKRSSSRIKDFNKNIAISALASVGALGGLTIAAEKALEFSDKMADADKVLNLSAKKGGLKEFRKEIMSMSKPLATIPADLATMAYEGAKVGISAGPEMKNFLKLVVKTRAAFDMSAQAAGEAIGDIKAKLNITIGDTERLLSQVNYMADTTSANGQRMLEIIKRSSGEFALMEFDTGQIAAFAGFADQIETSAELAASGMQMAFRRLQASPIYNKQFQKTPVKMFGDILEKLKSMDAVTRNMKIKQIFGDEAGRFVKKAVNNIDKLKYALNAVKTQKALKSMDNEWKNYQNRASFAINQIKVDFNKSMVGIGQVFIDFLQKNKGWITQTTGAIAEWITQNKETIQVIGAFIAILSIMFVVLTGIVIVFKVLTAAAALFGMASVASFLPLILIIIAVVGLLYIVYKVYSTITGKSSETVDNLSKNIDAVKNKMTGLQDYSKQGIKSEFKSSMMKKNETDITGNIRVSADQGSRVNAANFKVNQGSNFQGADFGFH